MGYGKCYVDFSYNEQGHLIATIEADKSNYYTKGVSGSFDLTTGEGDVKERAYTGAKEEHDVKRARETKDYSDTVWKSSKTWSPCRIIKDQNGGYILQKGEWGGPVVDGKRTQRVWKTTQRFMAFEEIGHDANYDYLSIKKRDGTTMVVNQLGSELSQRQVQRLLHGRGNGMKGPS